MSARALIALRPGIPLPRVGCGRTGASRGFAARSAAAARDVAGLESISTGIMGPPKDLYK